MSKSYEELVESINGTQDIEKLREALTEVLYFINADATAENHGAYNDDYEAGRKSTAVFLQSIVEGEFEKKPE